MKVGILTFHRAINYGAVLQAYALNKKINYMGADCEIVDYRNPHIENMYHKLKFKGSLRRKVSLVVNYRNIRKKTAKFSAFVEKNINKSPIYKTISKLKENEYRYDMFISGSDQVWNPDCTEFDKAFFLDFTFSPKKASYAASFGTAMVSDKYENEVANLISDFTYIGVREKQGAEYIKKITDKNVEVVLDPTFLLNKEEWEQIAKPSKYEKKKYVLIYMLMASKTLVDFARKVAKEKGCELISIGNGRNKDITYANDIGPDEFLSLIKNAEAVVTNSFHGTAFSINFGKEFYVELHNVKNARNSRMEDVLKLFELENRLICDGNCRAYDIDFEKTKKILEEEREKSVKYLEEVIKER